VHAGARSNRPSIVRLVGLTLLFEAALYAQPDGTVLIPGGRFRMGTAPSTVPELKRTYAIDFPGVFGEEVPEHTVTVSGFRMDRDEVTNARFARFVAARPEWSRAHIPPDRHNGHYLELWKDGGLPEGKSEHPVVFVTWHAAEAFCRWSGGRLPSEAEWEYAARAGRDVEFPWGDARPAVEHANFSASGVGGTRAVGSYPANPFGLHDMAGNVWEFLLDAWTPNYRSGPRADPVAGEPVAGDFRSVRGRRVLRGGSFDGAVVNLRTRWRDSHEVLNATAFVGFRCVYPEGKETR